MKIMDHPNLINKSITIYSALNMKNKISFPRILQYLPSGFRICSMDGRISSNSKITSHFILG